MELAPPAAALEMLGSHAVRSPQRERLIAERERACGVAFPASVVAWFALDGAERLSPMPSQPAGRRSAGRPGPIPPRPAGGRGAGRGGGCGSGSAAADRAVARPDAAASAAVRYGRH